MSRFSSGYFSRDVLFVEYIAVVYQVLKTFVVSILILSAAGVHVPIWSAVKICSFAFMLVFTLSLISSFVNIGGLNVIELAVVISPSAPSIVTGKQIGRAHV